MEIIGAGFGRTGTRSLQIALRQLGFGPCYHMLEVIQHPRHIPVWQAAADGETVDWRHFFRRYKAGVDFPVSCFYKDIMLAFPDAKVLLTVRDPVRWHESALATIYQGTALPRWFTWVVRPYRGFQRMVNDTVWDGLFDGRFEDREHAINVYEEHIAEVKRHVPADKLLVYHVKEGWEPLCAFLDVPVPDVPFPHANDRQTMLRRIRLAQVVAAALALLAAGLAIWAATLIL